MNFEIVVEGVWPGGFRFGRGGQTITINYADVTMPEYSGYRVWSLFNGEEVTIVKDDTSGGYVIKHPKLELYFKYVAFAQELMKQDLTLDSARKLYRLHQVILQQSKLLGSARFQSIRRWHVDVVVGIEQLLRLDSRVKEALGWVKKSPNPSAVVAESKKWLNRPTTDFGRVIVLDALDAYIGLLLKHRQLYQIPEKFVSELERLQSQITDRLEQIGSLGIGASGRAQAGRRVGDVLSPGMYRRGVCVDWSDLGGTIRWEEDDEDETTVECFISPQELVYPDEVSRENHLLLRDEEVLVEVTQTGEVRVTIVLVEQCIGAIRLAQAKIDLEELTWNQQERLYDNAKLILSSLAGMSKKRRKLLNLGTWPEAVYNAAMKKLGFSANIRRTLSLESATGQQIVARVRNYKRGKGDELTLPKCLEIGHLVLLAERRLRIGIEPEKELLQEAIAELKQLQSRCNGIYKGL